MNFNFKTLCAIGALVFGSVDAYYGIYSGTSLEVTSANKSGIETFEHCDLFDNLKELKMDSSNVGVLITRFEGNGRPFAKNVFPVLKKLDVVGSLTWEMIKQALKCLPTVSTLIIDPLNFSDKEDADIAKYVQDYKNRNSFIDESFTIPSCFVSGENGRIVIEGDLEKIENYKDEIYKICLKLAPKRATSMDEVTKEKNGQETDPVALVNAIKKGDIQQVKSIVNGNPSIIFDEFEGESMQDIAVEFTQWDIRDFLYNLEDQIETMVDYIAEGDIGEIKSLVENNSDLLFAKFEGKSMREHAIQFNRLNVVEFLDRLEKQRNSARNAIDAITKGDTQKVKSLVKGNLDIIFDKSIREHAIQFNRLDVVKFLDDLKKQYEGMISKIYEIVRRHRDIDKKDIMNERDELLCLASKISNKDLIDPLIKIGADVNRTDKNGCTPLFYTKNVEVAEKLISYGADVNHEDNVGFTWLTSAVLTSSKDREQETEKLPMVKFVLERIAKDKINKPTSVGNTALHIAARHNYPKIAQMLIDAGADINAENKEGKTPFDRAVQFDSKEVIELIFSKYSQKQKNEALVRAIKKGEDKVGNWLLDKANFSREQLIDVIKSTWN